MMRRAITLLGIACIPFVANAQEASRVIRSEPETLATTETSAPEAPSGPDAPTPQNLTLQGQNLYLAGRYEEAIAVFSDADRANPNTPTVKFYLGVAYARLERYDDALAAFRVVVAMAGAEEKGIAAKARFNIALVKERQGVDDAALTAWKAYLDFAEKNPKVPTFVTSGNARVEALERKRKLGEEYRIVQERIASGDSVADTAD